MADISAISTDAVKRILRDDRAERSVVCCQVWRCLLVPLNAPAVVQCHAHLLTSTMQQTLPKTVS
jgi:hypothetical protein